MSRIRETFTGYTVLKDGDGVCILSEIPVLKRMNERLGTSYRDEDMTGWNWVYEEALRVKKDEAIAQELSNNWFNPGILIKALPDKGVRFVSLVCHWFGFNLPVVTSRPPDCKPATISWFGCYFPWIAESQIHIRDDPGEDKDQFKARMAIELGPDIFFDDKGETIRDVMEITDARLVTRPWNREDTGLNSRRVSPGLPMLGAIARNFTFKLRSSL